MVVLAVLPWALVVVIVVVLLTGNVVVTVVVVIDDFCTVGIDGRTFVVEIVDLTV